MGNITNSAKRCCEKMFPGIVGRNNEKSSLHESLTNCNNDFPYSTSGERKYKSDNDCKNFLSISHKSLVSDINISLHDFKIIKTLGKGSFGKVLLVSNIYNKKYYAMKVLKKAFLKKQNQISHTKAEREILEKINHPFIVKLHYAFQSSDKLFLVTDFMPGGELFYHLRKEGCFTEERTQFYVCELILAIEHLHASKIIYRDLKPENILLDKDGHIKLTDFGLSKICKNLSGSEESSTSTSTCNTGGRAYTICGTPEYLAPEILVGKGYTKSVDWWSLGAVMYEMLVGHSPFKENKYRLELSTYLKVIQQPECMSDKAYNLIKELLQPDPNKRLGASDRDAEELKNHEFFKGVHWQNFSERKMKPKFRPYVKNEEDLNNFDRMFTEEDPMSVDNKFCFFPLNKKDRGREITFENFTYIINLSEKN